MDTVTGSRANTILGPVTVSLVTVTPNSAADGILRLYSASNTAVDPLLVVAASGDITNSIDFGGVFFPDGVLISPDAGVLHYSVQYGKV